MPGGLESIFEGPYPLGMVRAGSRQSIPAGGAYDLIECWLSADAWPNRRGGSTLKSTVDLGATGAVTLVWDGDLAAGRRTVFATNGALGVLSADDAGVTTLHSAGGAGVSEPVRPFEMRGLLFIPDTDSGRAYMYGGSRKTADYSTGTLTVTNGSKAVTGAGTSWLANVDAGMILADVNGGYIGVVAGISSDTALTLEHEWGGATEAGSTYVLYNVVISTDVTAMAEWARGNITTVGNRLVGIVDRNKLYVSRIGEPMVLDATTDYHELPEGAEPRLLDSLKDKALAFTDVGIWAISNMSLDLTDEFGNPQRRQERIHPEFSTWGRAGIVHWGGGLLVPAIDGLWWFDTISAPVKLSGRIDDLWRSHVRAGYRPGQAAVVEDHYLLPILMSDNNTIDFLVCRLTPTSIGPPFVWTRFRGDVSATLGATMAALAVRAPEGTIGPKLFGGGITSSNGRRLHELPYFEPSASRKSDLATTAHQLEIQTRHIPLGTQEQHVARLRCTHSTVDAASDNPTLDFAYAKQGASTWTALTDTAAESDGSTPAVIQVGKRSRSMAFRIRSNNAAASSQVRELELRVRRSGRT